MEIKSILQGVSTPNLKIPEPLVIPLPNYEIPQLNLFEYPKIKSFFNPKESTPLTQDNNKEEEEEEKEEEEEEKEKDKTEENKNVPSNSIRLPKNLNVNIEDQYNDDAIQNLEGTTQISSEVNVLTIPGTELEVPVPKAEILTAAGLTASVSVIATLSATWAFKRSVQVLKPLINLIIKRIQKLRNKPMATFGRKRLAERRYKVERK